MPNSLPAESPPIMFVELLRETQGSLYGFVRGMVGDHEQARDVVQDVYVDAWRAARDEAPPFEGGGDASAVRRWLFVVAYRTAASVLRHRRKITWETLDTLDPPETDRFYDPVAFEDQVAEGDVLHAILASMPPQDAACLLLNIVQGFTSAATGMMGHRPGDTGPTVAATRSGAAAVAYLGDKISADSVSCTLLRVTADPATLGNSHRLPDSEYLTVQIQLRNTGTTSARYDSSNFHVQAGTGNNMSEEAAIISSLGSGELAPGDSVGGDLVFNVPRGKRAVELTWSPLLGADMHQYAWLLEL